MYKHCKATEDKDMTPIDFLTDHLVNIDSIFDKHDKGDEQKPHAPVQFPHSFLPINYAIQTVELATIKPVASELHFLVYSEDFNFSEHTPSVFRPPIA